jgi:hypothetical protein
MSRPPFLKRSFAIPSTHGSWVWWLGPFAIGTAAGGAPGGDVAALFVAALAGFLLHQPAGIAVKAVTGRRAPKDLAPALAWIAIYTVAAASALPCLVAHGHARVLWLLVPGGLAFAGHLVLVARRLERRQMGVEMLEAGVLALAAPAAYAVSGGPRDVEAWVLWALCWVQTAGAIANVFVQLPPRPAPGSPPSAPGRRSPIAGVSVALQALGLAAAVAFAVAGEAPWGTLVPFGIVALEACGNVARPAAGRRPAQVGVRQLVVSLLFVAGMIAAWRLG